MSFDFSTLVTDRTQADLSNLKALLARAGSWTEADRAEFNRAQHKGAYNYTDLNRVTEAMECLDSTFRARGYTTGYMRVKDVWYAEDVPTAVQMQQYLRNVEALRSVLADGVSTTVPLTMEGLSAEEANDIEQVLVTINDLLQRMLLTLVPCGTATCGGDYL